MTIVALAMHKGGVGKTTIAWALATYLSREGFEVLVIDLDSQANLTITAQVDPEPALYEWVTQGHAEHSRSVRGRPHHDVRPEATHLRDHLDLIPGDLMTEFVNTTLSGLSDWSLLHWLLQPVRSSYEFILLDCPPSLSAMTRNAIYAADWVLCPTLAEFSSIAMVQNVMWTREECAGQGREVRMLGVLPNRVNHATKIHELHLDAMRERWGRYGQGGFVWPELTQHIDVERASTYGKDIWDVLRGEALEEWEEMAREVARYV
jgi:chromosome partitioning protein